MPTIDIFQSRAEKFKIQLIKYVIIFHNFETAVTSYLFTRSNYKAVTTYLDPYLLRDLQNIKGASL